MRSLVIALAALLALPSIAAAQGEVLPHPLAGEVFYYEGTVTYGEAGDPGEPRPTELAVRFLGPQEVRDRAGAARLAYGVESVRPLEHVHGSAAALMADPEAARAVVFHDLATFGRLERRQSYVEADEWGGNELGPVDVLRTTSAGAATYREFFPAGQADPYGALWGAPIPEGPFVVAWPEGSASHGMAFVQTLQALELGGLYTSTYDMPRSSVGAVVVEAAFEDLGWGRVGEHDARGFRAAYEVPQPGDHPLQLTRELWLAPGLAYPVKHVVTQLRGEGRDGKLIEQALVLAEHLPGKQSIPWGASASQVASLAPSLRPLGRDGPADGGADLAYPLAQAVTSVKADPTLLDYQRLANPVLVKAVYELRKGGDIEAPVPEARWYLMFQDERGNDVAVEAKRPVGQGLLGVNREVERSTWVGPDIDGVRPDELPSRGPTFGGAIEAWRAFRLPGAPGGEQPNTVAYFLQRMEDGTVAPIVWAGWYDLSTSVEGAGIGHGMGMSMLGVDGAGLPLLAGDGVSLWTQGVGPGVAPEDTIARAARPAPSDPVPAIAAAGLGAAALAGVALKLLAPLYSRIDRRRVLEHPTRRALLDLVEREPGVHLEAAQRALGVGAGQIAHHVHMLAQTGLLREQRAGRFRRLYPATAPSAAVQRDAALRQPRAAALYELARRRPGVGLREASRELGVPASSLQWHADRLEQAGLLQRRRDGLHALA